MKRSPSNISFLVDISCLGMHIKGMACSHVTLLYIPNNQIQSLEALAGSHVMINL